MSYVKARRRAIVVGLAVLAWATCAGAQPASAPAVPSRTQAKWLVDLGRDYPLTPQAGVRDADAQFVLAFMEAAVRLDADLDEPYLWKYDLLWALGRLDEASMALDRYVRLAPSDWSARVLWIAAATDSLQTLDERVRFWREQLARPEVPGEVASDLYRRLAEYAYNRNDRVAAAKASEESLRAFPENLAARRLQLDMTKPADDPTPAIALALDLVRLSPAQPLLAWDLARLLDDVSLHQEAQRWYRHAMTGFQRSGGAEGAPGEFLLQMAASQVDAGQPDSALKLIEQAIVEDGDGPAPHRLLARIARLRGDREREAQELGIAREAFESAWARTKDRPDPDLAAEMAWFYCVESPDIDRACDLADIAMRSELPSVTARRAFGWSAVQKALRGTSTRPSGPATAPAASRPSHGPPSLEFARRALESVAGTDPWAVIAMADLKGRDGDRKGAVAALTRVVERHRSGPLFEEASARLTALGAPIPPAPLLEGIRRLLAGFDESVLLFPGDPKKFLELRITPLTSAPGELTPGQPLWCRLDLVNRSPYGISLGPDLMVDPIVLLMVRSSGDRERDYDGLLRIPMNRRQFLAVGQTISVTQTIDIGALRTTLLCTPQAAQDIEILAILNPVEDEESGEWVPGPGGVQAGPARVRRPAVSPDDAGPQGLRATLAASRSDAVSQRIEATERLMMWLAEYEHLRAGRVRYDAQPVRPEELRAAIEERFGDPAWEVRAHLAEALRWIVLDDAMARPASGLLGDTHWLVRMLAVRLFADQQGAKFDKVASHFEQHDPDVLVRLMCAAVRDRWQATTQPAATQPAAANP